MTWIFAEDFEGCESDACINLTLASRLELHPVVKQIGFSDRMHWNFTTPEQAKAAYEKIKGMLKPYEAPF